MTTSPTLPPLLSDDELCKALPNVTVEWRTAKAIGRAIESAVRDQFAALAPSAAEPSKPAAPVAAVPTNEQIDALVKEHARELYSGSQEDWDVAAFNRLGLLMFARAVLALASPTPPVQPNRPAGCIKPDTDTHVYFYEQDCYVLSNFSAFRVTFDGQTFDTSEAAYHYQRFTSAEDRRGVQYADSAHEAFRYAQDHKARQRPDWDQVKVGIMMNILRAKADQHEYVRRKLLSTGSRVLVEDSWRDDFWGWGPNRDGQNMLGRLWMGVRSELRAALTAAQAEGEGK